MKWILTLGLLFPAVPAFSQIAPDEGASAIDQLLNRAEADLLLAAELAGERPPARPRRPRRTVRRPSPRAGESTRRLDCLLREMACRRRGVPGFYCRCPMF